MQMYLGPLETGDSRHPDLEQLGRAEVGGIRYHKPRDLGGLFPVPFYPPVSPLTDGEGPLMEPHGLPHQSRG